MHLALDSIAEKRKPYGSAPKQTVILNSVLKKILNGQRKKLKLLHGVWLSTDPDITISQNYKDKLEKIKATLGCWKFRRLSLLGKVLILKSLITSQLVYILSPIQSSPEAIKEINTIFYDFLWNGKGDKIKKCNDK